MKVAECIGCVSFPCKDINPSGYLLPEIDLDPEAVSLVLISEAAPQNPDDYYYALGQPSFQKNTLDAFRSAGLSVNSFSKLLEMGFYFTTAVKCAKTSYGVKAGTIKECSTILEEELALFPRVKVLLLMGDVAIKAINNIATRTQGKRAVPAGSTYKIRGGEFYFNDIRVFPSYLQVGPSYGIEKSKQRMIAEDIAEALSLI